MDFFSLVGGSMEISLIYLLQRNFAVALPPSGRLAMRSFEVSRDVPWVLGFVTFFSSVMTMTSSTTLVCLCLTSSVLLAWIDDLQAHIDVANFRATFLFYISRNLSMLIGI